MHMGREDHGGVRIIEVFCNPKRRHSTPGCQSAMQFPDGWLIAQQDEKLVA